MIQLEKESHALSLSYFARKYRELAIHTFSVYAPRGGHDESAFEVTQPRMLQFLPRVADMPGLIPSPASAALSA